MNIYKNQVSPIGEDAVEPCLDGWENCSRPIVSIFKGQDPTKPCNQVVLWNFLRVPVNFVPCEHVVVEDTSDSGNCQAKNGGDCDGCNKYGLCEFTREDPSHDGIEYMTLEEALAKVDALMDDPDNEDPNVDDSCTWDLINSHTSCASDHLSNARYEWDEARKTCEWQEETENGVECIRNNDTPVLCLFSQCPRAHDHLG